MFYEEFRYIDQAIAFEKQLKGWTRKKKQALIDGNWEKLKEYARCLNETASSRREKEWNYFLCLGFDSAQPDKEKYSLIINAIVFCHTERQSKCVQKES